jgi:hypothetical protein
VLCHVSVWGDASTTDEIVVALFRGTTCIQAGAFRTTVSMGLTLSFLDSPASASSQIYSVRVGPATGGTTVRLNGTDSARRFGGASSCTLTVSEIAA